ncbi:MAG: type II secretion system F family protein [Patescibacteria group bacterium]
MKFKYNARNQEGELQAGFIESASRETASAILTGHNLFILSLEETENIRQIDKILNFFNRVKVGDLMIFTRQFATLMESKVPLSNSLKTLQQQTKNLILKEAVIGISSDVDAGLFLSQAMERQGKIFSEFYINMIRSAEITGQLEGAMVFLADYIDKEAMWISRIRNALIYPAVVIVLFLGVAGVMLTTVFPQIAPIFKETGVELPFLTKVFLTSGSFILEWWWAILLILVILVFLLIDYFKSVEGKIVANELVIKIPVFGSLFKKIYVARFSESVSVLVKGGIPITQAIEISSHAIGNIVYRDILHEVAEGVRGGELLSVLLARNEYYFPALVGQMIAIGESTGRLDEILSRISTFYTREVNDILNNLTELIQPILIAVIGIFVGLLFASVLIPIYNLAQSF